MTWRSVVVSRPARLRREHYSLAIEQEQTAYVPFEDIAVILLNHREITVTHPVLSACGEYGISLFATDETHHPSGVFLPFLRHTRTTRMLRLQLALSRPNAKQAWAAIVKRKIANQAVCLRMTEREGVERLESYARRVKSGDNDRLEGQASAIYFPRLFGSSFDRSQDRWVNAALNYGYAVLRGTIARGLVAHGLFPTVGLFHSSEQNAFNLADDVIEPFRPVVDLYVVSHLPAEERELGSSDKAGLVGVLHLDVAMPRGTTSVLAAIEQAVEGLVRFYDTGDVGMLELPTLTGLHAHEHEC